MAKQRDSNWAFCTPAIAAGYSRWWRPDEIGMTHTNRPNHGLPNTPDSFNAPGNLVCVFAAGNPEIGRDPNRYAKAHQKGSGFGFATVDTEKKQYCLEAFRFLVDASNGNAANQFSGWPVTLQQSENAGENVSRSCWAI